MKFNIKRLGYAAMLGAIVATGSGCKKYLEEENRSAIEQDKFYANEAQAKSGVAGIYEKMKKLLNGDGYGESPFISLELPVGHATTLGQSFFNLQLIKHTAGSELTSFKTVWVEFYNGVANANLALAKLSATPMDENAKKALIGEVSFLRAFYYFHLVRLYGDIPLITARVTANSPDLYPSRATKEQIYDLIVKDLQTAEASGMAQTDRTGRVSLAAVKTLLANVYLTMAGQPLNKGVSHYQLAANKAKEVIDMGAYKLFTDYLFLHDRAHKNQDEFILQVQYQSGIYTNSLAQYIIPEKSGISKFGDEYGALNPLPAFAATYEAGDKRTQERQFFFRSAKLINSATIVNFGYPALFKYWFEEAGGANGDLQSDQNLTLMRLPETFLIYAEAKNEASGADDLAFTVVDSIRHRALLPSLNRGLTKDQFREAVWKERYHELCFENKAYFDLQRTRKAYDLKNNRFVDLLGYTNENGATFTEKYLLWPIPQTELDANPKLKPNNKGW